MDGPIHSRGTGRSGPKRKTGCLTCRRRKVRCDESRPVCANCVRLRLDCDYVVSDARSSRVSNANAMPANANARRTSSPISQMSSNSSQHHSIVNPSTDNVPGIPVATYNTARDHQWSTGFDPGLAFDNPFPGNFLNPLESFDMGLELSTTAGTFFTMDTSSNATNSFGTGLQSNVGANSSNGTTFDPDGHRNDLLEHFAQSVDLKSLMQPTHAEWTSACRSLITMASECAYLLSAICSLSALHLHCTVGNDSFDEASEHYRCASREVNSVLDRDTCDDEELKQAFAAIFLLSYIEVSILHGYCYCTTLWKTRTTR